jgi:hypothetical protein
VTTPTTIDRERLAAEVETLKARLAALPRREALDKAIYQCDRLAIAIRASHTEGTRFAAFTVAKIVRDLEADLPADVVSRAKAIRSALEATGLDLSK